MKALRATGITLALVVGGLSAASPAWATGTWDAPIDLSVPAADTWSDSAQMATSPDGTVVALWIDSVYADSTSARLSARVWVDGSWSSAPDAVSATALGIGSNGLVARDDNSFVAVWTETSEDADFQEFTQVKVSIFDGTSWSSPVSLLTAAVGEEVNDLQLAAASNGETIVVWDRDGTVETRVLTGSGWGGTLVLGVGNDPSVAAAPDNTLAVTWRTDTVPSPDLPAAKTWNGTTWSATVYLSDDTDGGFAPELGASPTGFVVMWMEGNDRLPWASTFTGTGWSSKFALREDNEIGGFVSSPGQVVSTPDGAVVTWNDGENNDAIVWARTFDGSAWGEPVELLPRTEVGLNNTLVAGSDGTLAVVWRSNLSVRPLMVRTFDGTTWGTPVVLSADENNPGGGEISVGGNGYVVATWTEGGAILSRTFDGAQWTTPAVTVTLDGTSPRVSVTTNNVFVVTWVGEGTDRSVIRGTTVATPSGSANPDSPELAATGASDLAGMAGLAAALGLLAGAILLTSSRRQAARHTH